MKKLIFVAIVLLLIALSFENVKLTVQGAGGPVPFAAVSLGNTEKFTDPSGEVEILKTVFQNNLKINRLGFKEIAVNLPFSLFYLKYNVALTPESYSGITEQLNNMLSGLQSYEYAYSLKVSSDNKTQTQVISAKFSRGNFIFSNKSDFTGADYSILYKNKNFYLINGSEKTLLEGEDKDNFISKNIIFLSANDLVSSILPGEEPQTISYSGNNVIISWEKAKAILTVGKTGMLSNLNFTQDTDSEHIEVHFSLNKVNESVEL